MRLRVDLHPHSGVHICWTRGKVACVVGERRYQLGGDRSAVIERMLVAGALYALDRLGDTSPPLPWEHTHVDLHALALEVSHGRRNAGDETATSGGHDDRVHVRQVLHDLHADRALPGQHVYVVVATVSQCYSMSRLHRTR